LARVAENRLGDSVSFFRPEKARQQIEKRKKRRRGETVAMGHVHSFAFIAVAREEGKKKREKKFRALLTIPSAALMR